MNPELNQSCWAEKGVRLPSGTRLRMKYKQTFHYAEIVDGNWIYNNQVCNSPSNAASIVSQIHAGKHVSLNGWIYWEAKKPDETKWNLISSLKAQPEK